MAQANAWPIQLDFAHVAGRCFVAYGWIAGLGTHVERARLQIGRWHCDLLSEASIVSRPDVSAHLGSSHPALAATGEELRHQHGFFVIHDWEGDSEAAIAEGLALHLAVQTQSGIAQHRDWTIVHGATQVAKTLRLHERAIRLLIGRQSPRQVRLLTDLFQPPLVLRAGDLLGADIPYGPALQLPIACAIQGQLILAGMLPGPVSSFHALTVRWYLHHQDKPRAVEVDILAHAYQLPDTPHWRSSEGGEPVPAEPRAFVAAVSCPESTLTGGAELELTHQASTGVGRQRLAVRSNAQDVQRRLAAWLQLLDAANRVAACEHILRAIAATDSQELSGWRESLTGHIEACIPLLASCVEHKTGPEQVAFFLEQAVPVPGVGVLLTGWAFADSATSLEVTYHAGGSVQPVSAGWVRRPRVDVQRHLMEQGLGQVDEPGFICLVALPPSALPLRPAYLKAVLGEQEWRVKVPAPGAAEPVRKLIRTLLATVDPHCSELRRLMDDHIGRAVQATWDRRPPPRSATQRWQFGPPVAQPTVSIVVPLFGRNDLADCQLALFTDDPDLHGAELIYVMDDPSALHEFRLRCTDLYRMHGLPFTLSYPGDNLGFAGACNHGATLARAPLLLLLNSDVFPREPGWLGQMEQSFRRHPDTGLLGAKLLYEDGSVQHAGMDSVPFEGWHGMWINRHPHKGLHPDGLHGVQVVPAVTAACVMTETGFFRSLGGLSEDYIIGDFEDSDLCYRARERGRLSRVNLDIVLYHLERQSQSLGDPAWRTAVTLYNCWIHDGRWARALPAARP